ncbi:MAG TPA: SIS domain-containing protein, partial [Victivallales bacterium]|nr:SIS domain-containing protein [Victivallales bacterium]
MTILDKILSLSADEKTSRGLLHTPAEIAQQPDCWKETLKVIRKDSEGLKAFLKPEAMILNPKLRIVFTGAGTSEFIGTSVEQALRKTLKVDCDTRATTDIITSWDKIFIPSREYLVVSFARSGNSPESVATYDIVKKKVVGAKQLIITCNKDGELAKRAKSDKATYCVVLPPQTNDKSLAMTSSYSSMAVAAMALGFLDDLDAYSKIVELLCSQAKAILMQSDLIYELAKRDWKRGVFLGTGSLY